MSQKAVNTQLLDQLVKDISPRRARVCPNAQRRNASAPNGGRGVSLAGALKAN